MFRAVPAFVLSALLVLSTAEARRSSSSSSRSSSRSRSSWGSSSKRSTSRPKSGSIFKKKEEKKTSRVNKSKTVKPSTRPKSGSTFKSKSSKPKGKVIKKSAVDQKLAKKMASQKRKFTSKKDAEEAYKKTLSKNKYDSKPSTRPQHIPESYSSGGTTYQTVFVGGQYGYYMGGAFRPYTYADYVVDQALLEAAGWWDYDHIRYRNGVASYHSPVRASPTNGNDVIIAILVVGAILGVMIVAVVFIRKGME